ncbi:MAG: hypothetical protein KatS3mg105_1795 [Gemmatales bacterium]|nr:MAG: hypothetical protein KatS3mg105_1795 [Gemmatales bacterium]
MRRLFALLVGVGLWSGSASGGLAQQYGMDTPALPATSYQPLNRYFYYPFYYFPHSYWPSQGAKWPEPVGAPYRPPPAYMAYPPFREPYWRYEYFEPQRYYRGFHFWLDQF